MKIHRKLPNLIKTVLLVSEGWLVGGAIQDVLDDKEPDDFDIIVPSRELYQLAVKVIDDHFQEMSINSYGGIKVEDKDNDFSLDIWCEELGHFLMNAKQVGHVFNYKKRILIKKEDM